MAAGFTEVFFLLLRTGTMARILKPEATPPPHHHHRFAAITPLSTPIEKKRKEKYTNLAD